GPWCGGSLMRMPAAGSRPVITSQKLAFVATPMPSGEGHTISGAACWSGGGATGARRAARACSPAAGAAASASATPTAGPAARRTSVLRAGQAGRFPEGHGTDAHLDEIEELHAGARVVAKGPQHRARHGDRVLLLDAAHRHAEVRGFHQDGHAERRD